MDLMQGLTHFLAPPQLLTAKPTRPDADDIVKPVARYCRLLGCDESNTIGAIAWALREPGSNTLAAVRAGKKRADQLHFRQRPPSPPIPA